MTYNTCP